MRPDDRIRAAYRNLAARAAREADVEAGLTLVVRGRRRRMVPALAAAAAVVALVGGVALFASSPPPTPDEAAGPGTPSVATPPPAPETVTTFGEETTPPPTTTVSPEATLLRVDTERVAADAEDPFLDLHVEPDPTSPIVAELAPSYTGIRWRGDAAIAPDGSVWYEVELEDPVAVDPDVLDGRYVEAVGGWVDSAFLIPLPEGVPVTAAELPPCDGDSDAWRTGPATPMHVSSLRVASVAEGCTRVVVGFSTGEAASTWSEVAPGTVPAATPAGWREVQSPWPLIVDLPDVTSAWPTAAGDSGVYLVRQPDRSLSLVVTHPTDEVWIRSVRGLMVIDLGDAARPQPPNGASVALVREPMVRAGGVEAVGIARPFEAMLSTWVENTDGVPVEAVFSGSPLLGTRRTDVYTIPTIDWVEVWAPFAVRVDGLAPGDYRLVFDPGGDGSATFRVPFTVRRSGTPPPVPSDQANEVARRIIAFAGGGEPPPLAEEVILRLADQTTVTRPAAVLTDRSGWVIDAPGFAGRDGPFDLLAGLRDRPNVTVGEERVGVRCGGQPTDWWPTETLARTPIVLEPVGIDSCLEWYSVSVLVDGSGAVTEFVLDLSEP